MMSVANASAQRIISGSIIDSGGRPVDQCTVVYETVGVNNSAESTVTDFAGDFIIDKLTDGIYSVYPVGTNSLAQNVTIPTQGDPKPLFFKLTYSIPVVFNPEIKGLLDESVKRVINRDAALLLNKEAAVTINPAAARKINPLAAQNINPEAARTLDSLVAKEINPAAAVTINPVAAAQLNPEAASTISPELAKTISGAEAKALTKAEASK